MKQPPFICLFCSSSSGPFTTIEHPIPESLGNDEMFIEPGWVCDTCNHYFGTKVEAAALNYPPFGIERVAARVPTKKGKLPHFHSETGLWLLPSDFRDVLILGVDREDQLLSHPGLSEGYLTFPHDPRQDFYIARMLIKMGLELLTQADEIDPYDSSFDNARRFARYGSPGTFWEFGFAVYPRRDDLTISERMDEHLGPLVTHQLYEYSAGQLSDGSTGFCFVYSVFVFSTLLSTPFIEEYLRGFNSLNHFQMQNVRAVAS